MALCFQAVPLVAPPSYPNAIAWSDENLIAVASGHLVTILNPALPFGPRGLITVPLGEPFPLGVVDRKELLSGCLLPTCLSRDRRPCVRSIAWSPLGMASNSGCLLAVCTTEGCVKLYRPPFCDFGAEWIEVMDVSERLYNYLERINFGKLDVSCTENSEQATGHRCAEDSSNFISKKVYKRRKITNKGSGTICRRKNKDSNVSSDPHIEMETVPEISYGQLGDENSLQIVPVPKSKAKSLEQIPEKCTLPQITASQYASCSAMLSSLTVAWSPLLPLSCELCPVPQTGSSVSLLALGCKSGNISIWRVYIPECYSVECSRGPTTVTLVGLLQAHLSWITSISWALLASDSSNPQILLATGSSDGSVRIWLGNNKELLNSSEVNSTPLFLLKKVIIADAVPVSVLSLSMPAKSTHKMLLAVGKGSGSFEVWNCDIYSNNFEKFGSYDAHDNVVTGLAWAFDGSCLYSCSQDNFVRSWIVHGSSLCEVPIPSNTPHLRSSVDLPDVFISCIGVAMSPGNLVVAMARNLDLELLDPMYQARAQKAVVEFYWIGGQQLDRLSNTAPLDVKGFPCFPDKELACWESNIIWSLKKYEHLDEPLVVWDIVASLLAFKQTASKFVEHILLKWLSYSYTGSEVGLPAKKLLPCISASLSKINSRQLHLLNIICRRVMLLELKADQINRKLENLRGLSSAEGRQLTVWMELLFSSERELRERLLGFSFSASTSRMSHRATTASRPGYWYPIGLAQMERWVALNHDHGRDQLKALASEVGRHETSEYAAVEQCSYCSAPVPFDSPEVGFCRGIEGESGIGQSHTLPRCAVSMQICPTTPLWFCICCNRRAFRLAPETLFSMPRNHVDFKSSTKSSVVEVPSKPLCPFCGILLQRLQPDFLLSASPV
ncbi:hypothetical protein I3842_05G198700 [Carya illinoinensis]|uniref:Transcription factor IIIC 90kDa subunit N-terminal domain-containing protein n=1 Tax=Carya illinoinensis TaxID=32201 RepID=A0A922JNH6_CARIL|nr:hypothetical protein I3842_05G198700 [Carya illinoinensis]